MFGKLPEETFHELSNSIDDILFDSTFIKNFNDSAADTNSIHIERITLAKIFADGEELKELSATFERDMIDHEDRISPEFLFSKIALNSFLRKLRGE